MTTPRRVTSLVPRGMLEDPLLVKLTAIFDELLDGVATQVDDLALLTHPALAPDAMVGWLCSWLGWDLADWPSADAGRRLLRDAGELLTYRGTARGLQRLAEVLGGADVTAVQVVDPGSTSIGPPTHGSHRRRITVVVHGPIATTWSREDLDRFEQLILSDLAVGHPAEVLFRSPTTFPPDAPAPGTADPPP
ncbi:phage tail protein [Lentzea sp. NPDC004782]|uniref:phage tail protein n=1 Tax=Lentzea sp. NPDC004782 TaxID=3154458 RepID=UPI0033A3D902